MGLVATLRRLFSREEVQALHEEVLGILEELDPPEDLRPNVYQSLVTMCGQHTQPGALAGFGGLDSLRPG